MSSLTVELKNASVCPNVFAYVTGYAIDRGNALMLLGADGQTPYYPASPPAGKTCQPLSQDCSIPLGPPNSSIYITIPHIAGCRIWFSYSQELIFLLNPGPALVEPSCTNQTDPNINVRWSFAELTYSSDQIFANISAVDFFSIPIGITLQTTTGRVDHVSGGSYNALSNICRDLKAQSASDGQPWSSLIVNDGNGQPLRVLSPNNGIVLNPNLFKGYFDGYIQRVWAEYQSATLSVDTQAQWGLVNGWVQNGTLVIDGQSFSIPSTADVFSCCTGPFAGGSPEKLCIAPRLAAGFNRSTLLSSSTTPDPQGPQSFYRNAITNHYARIVHNQLLDGRGYAFPYDDVCASGGPDQCGAVYDGNPRLLTIAVGGNSAYVDPGATYLPTYAG